MADPKIVGEWLNKADEDFNFADANLPFIPFLNIVNF